MKTPIRTCSICGRRRSIANLTLWVFKNIKSNRVFRLWLCYDSCKISVFQVHPDVKVEVKI